MSRNTKLALAVILALAAVILGIHYLTRVNLPLLFPDGSIGRQERNLIYLAAGLSLIVVIPVYFMLGFFAWKYRESNKNAKYDPDFDHSRLIESIWWGVPLAIITILAVVTWNSSHTLDPYKPIASQQKTLNIQVVAMEWRWLFIYPQQNIATMNLVQFPQKTPVQFDITADAPMNSFWIPQLGGQIYAMSGMATKMHLIADKTGSYQGYSANISGKGFADMSFTANSVTQSDFDKWVGFVRQYRQGLDFNSYQQLAKPTIDSGTQYYSDVSPELFHQVVDKYNHISQPYGAGAI
ncbi:MAG TPA: ubiquinol oxidase subunit II [Candidatus Saccharimonadales bacterium]|nr:ubiquinol oxidase subunit II [Candidatus Saccharimonadales bacterium]